MNILRLVRPCAFLLVLSFALVACSALTPAPVTLSPSVAPTSTNISATSIPTPPTSSPTKLSAPEHRIRVRRVNDAAEFYDRVTGKRFVPRGVNYFYIVPAGRGFQDRVLGVGVYDRERVTADFKNLSQHGYNTVRIFFDSCQGGAGCIGLQNARGLNPIYLSNMVEVMRRAKEHGLYLVLNSNDIPDGGGYGEMANRGANQFFAGYRNAHFLSAEGVGAMSTYWRDLLKGLSERNAPFDAVLGWSLLNEQWFFENQPPLSLNSGKVTTANGQTYDLADREQKRRMLSDGVVYLIAQTRRVVLEYDPTALITMGFFVPSFPNPMRLGDGWNVDTLPLLRTAPLDFFDFHAYPGTDDLRLMAQNFGMIGYTDKPIIMGEVGAFTSRYFSVESATRSVQAWIAESCAYGFDGWLYWGYYRAPEALGDSTWGFVEQNGTMLKALAPINQPDSCVTTNLPSANLALGRPVKASRSLPNEPPLQAVDGKPTQWGAGSHPPQWIEIDLERPAAIRLIRLVVAQYPEGETVHQVYGKGASGDYRLLHEFRGVTRDNQILEYTPPTPWQGIQFVKVETVASPSWVS